MKEIIEVLSGLNVMPLKEAVEKNDELFKEHTERQNVYGSAHQNTETIFLRWAADQSLEAAFTHLQAVDYPASLKLPEAVPIIKTVLHALDVKSADHLGRILIVKFHPKGFITPHIDEGPYADHFERFHLVLASEPGNHFMVETYPGEGEFLHMQPGSVYWFNHKRKHSVVNFSDANRLHMIIDAVAPSYRRERQS